MYVGMVPSASRQARNRQRELEASAMTTAVPPSFTSGKSVAAPDASSSSATSLLFERPKTQSAAVRFQGPGNATSRPALIGSIAGVGAFLLLFIVYEVFAIRRKRRRLAAASAGPSNSEGVPFLAVQSSAAREARWEEGEGKYTFSVTQPTTHMVSLPQPARLNANQVWSRAPAGQ